jgi:hypothetical protein
MTPLDLTLHHVSMTCEAVTDIHFGIHAGAQWRGALWDTLRQFACTDPSQQGVPEHSYHCPMCFVLALEAPGPRGVNPARPLVIRPPLAVRPETGCSFSMGEQFTLEMVLVGAALSVFPYLVQAVQRIGHQGVAFGRGRFQLLRIEAVNKLASSRALLYEHKGIVRMPDIPVTGVQVQIAADKLPEDHIRLHFLTPTQLVMDGNLLTRPQPHVLVMRILERLQALEYHYGQSSPQEAWKARHEMLSSVAACVHLRRDETRWIRAFSGSHRANRIQDVSGFTGSISLEGDIAPLRLWLLWASLVNVGKNAIKGNGWLEISA